MNISDNNKTTLHARETYNPNESSIPILPERIGSQIELIRFTTIIYIFFITFGIIGNLATCAVIVKRKSMHTVINYYFFSLAISDLVLLVITIPEDCLELWDVTIIAGVVYNVISELMYEVSILTVIALSIERYVAICHPITKQLTSNKRVAFLSLTIIWVSSAVIAPCFVLIPYEEDFYTILLLLNSGLFYIMPFVVILVLYIAIGVTLTKRNVAKSVKKDVKLVVAVVSIFLICWAPNQLLMFSTVFGWLGWKQRSLLSTISNWLYVFSTILNPVLYTFMSKKFREEFEMVFLTCAFKNAKTLIILKEYQIEMHHPGAFTKMNKECVCSV